VSASSQATNTSPKTGLPPPEKQDRTTGAAENLAACEDTRAKETNDKRPLVGNRESWRLLIAAAPNGHLPTQPATD